MVLPEVRVYGEARKPPLEVHGHVHLGERLVQQLAVRGDDANVAGELLSVEQPPVRGERHGGGMVGLGDQLRLHAERVAAAAAAPGDEEKEWEGNDS